jgi:hypothetical protein
VLSLIENAELLYPIYANVLLTAKLLYEQLRDDVRRRIVGFVRTLIKNDSHVIQTELNLSYAIRLLACGHGPENEEILNKVYGATRSTLIRRDIVWLWPDGARPIGCRICEPNSARLPPENGGRF